MGRTRQLACYTIETPPKELKEHIPQDTFEKSQAYGWDKTVWSLCKQLYNQAINTVLIKAGAYKWAWSVAGGWMVKLGLGGGDRVVSRHIDMTSVTGQIADDSDCLIRSLTRSFSPPFSLSYPRFPVCHCLPSTHFTLNKSTVSTSLHGVSGSLISSSLMLSVLSLVFLSSLHSSRSLTGLVTGSFLPSWPSFSYSHWSCKSSTPSSSNLCSTN